MSTPNEPVRKKSANLKTPRSQRLPTQDSVRELFLAEPAAQYLVPQPAVVDASLLCAVLFAEPEAPAAQQQLDGRRLCAPRFLAQEVLNVIVTKHRRGLELAAAQRVLAIYEKLTLELIDPDLPAQLTLALRYGLSGYDAAYLWLAGELRAPLLTFDRKLAQAAQQHLAALG